MDDEVSTHTFLTMIIEESVCFMSGELIFICNYSFVVHTEYIFISIFIFHSGNLPERVQILGHAHIICITVREDRIICCQIFGDLLLKYSTIFAFHITMYFIIYFFIIFSLLRRCFPSSISDKIFTWLDYLSNISGVL